MSVFAFVTALLQLHLWSHWVVFANAANVTYTLLIPVCSYVGIAVMCPTGFFVMSAIVLAAVTTVVHEPRCWMCT